MTKDFGARRVLEDVTVAVHAGDKIGIVGGNGTGKSTLLRILAGAEEYHAGRLEQARRATVGWMTQELDWPSTETGRAFLRTTLAHLDALGDEIRALERDMASPSVYNDQDALQTVMDRYSRLCSEFEQAEGYEADARLRATAFGLGFSDADLDRPISGLSGGEKVRLNLARLLLSKPDVLLLDEPTNHLDMQATEWLEEFLQGVSNAVIVVSHDRYFLDAVTSITWEVERQRVVTYPASFSRAMELKVAVLERQQVEYDRQQAEIARLEDYVRRYKAGQRTKQAQSRENKLARMQRIERPHQKVRGPRIDLGPASRTGLEVLSLTDICKSYDGNRVLVNIHAVVERGDRIGIVGANGAGKSTLLRLVTGEEQPDHGEIRLGEGTQCGYLTQEAGVLNPEHTVIDEILQVKHMTTPEARSFLARFLFIGEEVFAPVRILSGGERNRVALARLLLKQPNVLLLDEPTNHLDIFARSALEQALLDFTGTLLVVSHDRYFLDTVINQIWALKDGGLTSFPGTYSDYRQWVREADRKAATDNRGNTASREPQGHGRKDSSSGHGRQDKAHHRKQRGTGGRDTDGGYGDAETLTEEIAVWESRKEALEITLADPDMYASGDRVREVVDAHKKTLQHLEDLYMRWEAVLEKES